MTSRASEPMLSVVVPVYNEAGNIAPLFHEIERVMTAIGRPFEVLYVNDGSTDATLPELRQLEAAHRSLRILDLDGNFGEAAALAAGFHAARGDLVVTLDGDGQNDPRHIPLLLTTLENGPYQAVSGWRQQRQEGRWLRVLPSRIANRLIAALTGLQLHDAGCGLKVYRRELVRHAVLPRGMHRFLPAILGVPSTAVAEVMITDRRRERGASHYGIGRAVVVGRDLLALPFLIAAHRRSATPWVVVALIGSALSGYGLCVGSHVLLGIAALASAGAAMVAWNLRRFQQVERHGAYRLRGTSAAAQGAAPEGSSSRDGERVLSARAS